MKVGDSDRAKSARRPETAKPAAPKQATPAAKPASSPRAAEARAERAGASSSSGRSSASSLDREPSSTGSNASASREVTRRQASTAAAVTGADDDGPSTFDALATEDDNDVEDNLSPMKTASQKAVNDKNSLSEPAAQESQTPEELERARKLDHLVDNPVEQEQRSDLQTPEPFQPGSPRPEVPNLSEQTPSRSETTPGGNTVDTIEQDGVAYTRTTRPDGTVSTSYEQDGINYSNTAYGDGRSSTLISDNTDEGLHQRTIDTAADGGVTDTSRSSQGTFDGDGNWSYQSREETLSPDGVRTVNEQVKRPDGGTATVSRTVQPDGRVAEVYDYQGDQGTVNRSTNTAADGTAETRTERSYTIDQPLETVLSENGVAAPAVPSALEYQVPPLPEGEREDTQVREVEVVTTDAAGAETVQYSEESFSQTSGDVTLNGSQELGQTSPSDTFPLLVTPNNDASSATRTVTTVKTRDENGQLVSSTGASQSVTLVGDRPAELGGGQANVTRTDSWNETGESSSTFATEGFREEELYAMSLGSDQTGGFSATLGDRPINAGYPDAGVSPFDAYNRKGGGELEDWLGTEGSDGLDVSVTVNRNAEGEVTNRNLTLDALDASGDGRTATRTDSGGAVGWTYSDYSNNGQDYDRQTVFEGTDVSIYESHQVTGPGQFRTTSETKEGDSVVASSDTSRQEVTAEQLNQSVADGEMSQAQLDRMLTDGPPYYAERYSEHAEPLRDDDGNLRTDEDGNVIQAGHTVSSYNLANSDGYAVAKQYRETPTEGGGSTSSTLKSVTDPQGAPPISGTVTNRETSASGSTTITDTGDVRVTADGKMTYNGVEMGQFDLSGSELTTLLKEGDSVTALSLLGAAGGVTNGGLQAVNTTRFTPSGAAQVEKLSGALDIFGVGLGANNLFQGVRDGDGRAIVEGIGEMAGGLNSLAAATAALGGTSKLGNAARSFSSLSGGATVLGKALGGVGGVIGLGFGLYDVFTADSGWDKAAGGLAAASGAVAVGSVFFGPPGWVVGGLISGALGIASIFVGGADDNATAPIDDRMR